MADCTGIFARPDPFPQAQLMSTIIPHLKTPLQLLGILESTSIMSEYNDLFDFDAPAFAFDAVDSEYPAPPSGPGQSAAWTATLQPLVGLMGGNTTAELQLDTDPAPSVVAEPLG